MSFGTKSTGDQATAAWANLIEDTLGNGYPALAASYVVFEDTDNSLFKARSAYDGTIVHSDSDFATVLQAVIDDIDTNTYPQKIFIDKMNASITSEIVVDIDCIIQGCSPGIHPDSPTGGTQRGTELSSNTLGATDAIFRIDADAVQLSNLFIYNWASGGGYGVELTNTVSYCTFRDMDIRSYEIALRMAGANYLNRFYNCKFVASYASNTTVCIDSVSGANNNAFFSPWLYAVGATGDRAVRLQSGGGANLFADLYINSAYATATTEYLIDFASGNCSRNHFYGVSFDMASGTPTWYGFRFTGSADYNLAFIRNEAVAMTEMSDAGTGNMIWYNGKFVNDNGGTATVANGTTSIAVTHGAGYTPDADHINVHPIETLNNATFFWVDTITSTQFTINVDGDPGQDVDFAWNIRRLGS